MAACSDPVAPPVPAGSALARRAPDVTMTALSMRQAIARGVSDNGIVVGQFMGVPEFGTFGPRAFVYRDGVLSELPSLGGPNSWAADVSPSGVVVGWADPSGAVAWIDGVPHPLPTNGCSGAATAIDADGDIVGYCGTQPVLWRRGEMIELGLLPGTTRGAASAINARGQIVGSASGDDGRSRAFLWDDGTMRDLGTLGGSFASASGIDARGDVVGQSETSDGSLHAFIWRDGAMTDLDAQGASASFATGINARGQVSGHVVDARGHMHAFLWEDGVTTMLDSPLGGSSEAWAINDRGDVVGAASFTAPVPGTHPVLWTVR